MLELKNFPRFHEFAGKTILCIDHGQNVIGLAIFTPGREPFPLTHGKIINKGLDALIKELEKIIDEDFIELIVFGIPYLTDGSESDKTKEMIKNYNYLKSRISQVQWFTQDETLTTYEAKKRMESSAEFNYKIDMKKIDELSAVIILEDFIKS